MGVWLAGRGAAAAGGGAVRRDKMMADKYETWTADEEAEVRKQVHEGNAGRAYYGADWLEDMKLALGTLDEAREQARIILENNARLFEERPGFVYTGADVAMVLRARAEKS
jgi:hypothetical protein